MNRRIAQAIALAALIMALLGGVALAKTVEGNDRPNNLFGTDNNDTLSGLGGNDTICGQNGDDTYFGGEGPDVLSELCEVGNNNASQDGNDTLNGGPGTDLIEGNDGDDTIRGGDDDDRLGAGRGRSFPLLLGGADNDRIFGGKGNDGLAGEGGEDELFGQEGNDFLVGPGELLADEDLLDGGPGRDICVVDSADETRSCEVILEPGELRSRAAAEYGPMTDTERARLRDRFLAEHAKGR